MADDAAPHLARQIETFEQVHKTQALLVVAEALRTDLIERALACMAEGRVAEIVAERDRLGQILVQAERRAIVRAICATSSVCVRRAR